MENYCRTTSCLRNYILEYFGEKTGAPCENCGNCVKACPAMAILGNKWETGVSREALIDAHACSEYMSNHFKNIGRGSVCGICMKVCPQNKSK